MRTLVNCQRQMNMLSRLAIMLLRKILLPGGAFALTAVGAGAQDYINWKSPGAMPVLVASRYPPPRNCRSIPS